MSGKSSVHERRNRAAALLVLGCLCPLAVWGEARAPERNVAAAEVALTQAALALDEGRYQGAVDLLEEEVKRDQENGTALYWLGLAYLKLGRADDAVERLKRSLVAARPPAAGKRRVRVDLGLIQRARAQGLPPPEIEPPDEDLVPRDPLAPPPWSAQAGLVLGADSNPGLLPETLSGLPLFGNGPRIAESDAAAQLDFSFDLVPFYDRNGWSLGVSFSGSHSIHRHFGDLDLTQAGAHFSLAWGGDPGRYLFGPLGSVQVPQAASRLSIILQGGGFDLRLGGDDYLRVAEAGGSLALRESATTATRLDVIVRNRSFQREGPDPHQRSGGEASLELSQCFDLGRPYRQLRLGLIAGNRGGGRDFQSSLTGALGELSTPLGGRWTLLLMGTWRQESFAHPESRLGTSGPDREDTSWTITGTLAKRLNEHLAWTLAGSYLRNDSNLELALGGPVFDYRRTLVSTGLTWSFQ